MDVIGSFFFRGPRADVCVRHFKVVMDVFQHNDVCHNFFGFFIWRCVEE